ncbi:hypothetical protein [Aeromicrobium sp. CF3.5]|uniref:hypothetical protein n=1 Tax=Aeromicrobium sp. CF3.5 TaxID=3373078 RepID=UPI003EE55779
MTWRPGKVRALMMTIPESDDLDLLQVQRRARAVSRWENEGGGLTAVHPEEEDTCRTHR